MADKQQVVITGIGLVTPLGNDTEATWNALVQGRSGLSLAVDSTLQNYPCKAVGVVKGEQELLSSIVDKNVLRKTERFTHLNLIAAHHAIRDAGFDKTTPTNRDRFGCYVGIGIGGVDVIGQGAINFLQRGYKSVSPFMIPKAINNLAPSWVSMQNNLHGPTLAITSACSSGGDALGSAFRLIRDGYADNMLAGGVESCVIPIAIVAFGNMRALSNWQGDPALASRPFDAQRKGFVLAEGAGMLMLERKDFAKKRGAHIYAEMVGYGSTSDAYHITAMHPEGRGAIGAINMALDDAKVDHSQIGYINAHGTGTAMNDKVETMVLKKVFGHHIDPKNPKHILVSSTKSMTGHMIGGSGGVEAAVAALSLQHQIVPPTINLENPDPACNLDYVPNVAREVSMQYAMSNSFGFGGSNAVVLLKKA